MAPPNPVSSTKDLDTAPVPSAAPEAPSATPEAPATPAPPMTPTPPQASDSSAGSSQWWRRLHLVLGGGYNFGTRVNIDSPAYARVAPSYSGGMFFVQPSYSVFSSPHFDFRIGADFRISPLGVSRRPGAPDSSITATSIGGMIEGTYLPHEHFGIGLNFAVGYLGLSSHNADVGAPVTATLDFGSEGGAYLGAQLFVTSWNQAIRLGVSLDTLPGGFGLNTGPSSPAANTVMSPMWTVFVGVDPIRIISNVVH